MTSDQLRRAWRKVPVDNQGYVDVGELISYSDTELRKLIAVVEQERYAGWRNQNGLWRKLMTLDVGGRDVLDYGCGIGIEALQYARSGNRVSVADINGTTVQLASNVLWLHHQPVHGAYPIGNTPPLTQAPQQSFDLVAMNGVLHHIEHPQQAVLEAWRLLRDGGELRVMVYSADTWRQATGTEPPDDVASHPQRLRFAQWTDFGEVWADWYDQARLEKRFGRWFTVRSFDVITAHAAFAVAVMDKR